MENDLCISCGKKPVTWPRVCIECKDHEAQAQLELRLIDDGIRTFGVVGGGFFEEEYDWVGGECKTCGMLHDGGMRCTYCGDEDPWDQGSEELPDNNADLDDDGGPYPDDGIREIENDDDL